MLTRLTPICSDLRIAFGGIATHPYRSPEAESLVKGNKPTEVLAGEAVETALSKAKPAKINHYKPDLSTVLLRRALVALPRVRQLSGIALDTFLTNV